MARKKTTGTETDSHEAALAALLKSTPGRNPALLLDKIGSLIELSGRLKHPEAT